MLRLLQLLNNNNNNNNNMISLILLLAAISTTSAFPSGVSSSTNMNKLSVQESLSQAIDLHKSECQTGFDKFGRTLTEMPLFFGGNQLFRVFCDDDFYKFPVGKQNAGPDHDDIKNGDIIFQTKERLMQIDDMKLLIDEARAAIDEGLKAGPTGPDGRPTNAALGEAKVSELPWAREWLKEKLHIKLFPLLRDRFGVSELTLHDALIIGYGYFGGGSLSQPVHRDSSLLSINIALSPCSDYEGGGTYFEPLGRTLHQELGHVTCHPGGIMHAGQGISSGERWILVLFVLDDSRPQLARRSHALGLEAQRSNDVGSAKSFLEASLSIQPENHLVYKDLGRTYMNQGNPLKSRLSLAKCTRLYPHDVEAALGLSKMLWQGKRPRAALRRLDKLLTHVGTSDLKDDAWMPLKSQGWEARVLAASCALYCSQRRPACRKAMLPTAIERLQVCIDCSPMGPPPNVVEMYQAAQGMYQEALQQEG